MRSFALLAAAAALAPVALAQTAIPDCVLSCLTTAATSASCSSNDISCLCQNESFISSATSCLETTCEGDDVAIGLDYGVQYCATVGISISVPNPADVTSTDPASTAASSVATTGAGASSSASAITSAVSSVLSTASTASSASSASTASAASSVSAAEASPTNGASSLAAGSILALAGAGAAAFLL
ncbi:hypothetical protein JCM10207_000609 [Rhodosporidiobolus poonsookiae]